MDRDPDADHTLVELLYGELDGAARDRAEARVAADPARATELAELRSLRDTLRTWGNASDAEPPADVSTLLAAARASARPVAVATEASAPGLWERLARWLAPLLAHPGLAAAATLVLVGGVAGTLYMTGASQMAEPTAAPARSLDEVPSGAAAAPEPAAVRVPAVPREAVPAPAATEETAPATRAASGAADERRQRVESKPGAAEKPKTRRRDRGEAQDGTEGGVAGGSFEREEAAKAPRQEAPKQEAPEQAAVAAPSRAKADVAAPAPAKTSAPAQVPPARGPSPSPAPSSPAPSSPAPSAPSAPSADDTAERAAPGGNDLARLTREAREAAARADCARVRTLSERVRGLDAAYHERTFRADKAIAACLAAKKL